MAQLFRTESIEEKEKRIQVLAIASQTWNQNEAFVIHLGRLHQYYEEGVYLTDLNVLASPETSEEQTEENGNGGEA